MIIPTFDRILELVETHGDPIRCKKENCEICKEIYFARNFYTGGQAHYKKGGGRGIKFVYTAIDESGKERKFYHKADLRNLVKCSNESLDEAIESGTSRNGFMVYKENYTEGD